MYAIRSYYGITERCQAEDANVFTTNSVADVVSYNWVVYPAESGVGVPTDNSVSIEWNIDFTGETGVYVEAVNVCGFTRSDTLFVQTNPSPFQDLGNDTTICSGTILTLDAGLADSYLWNNGSVLQTISVAEQGSYNFV